MNLSHRKDGTEEKEEEEEEENVAGQVSRSQRSEHRDLTDSNTTGHARMKHAPAGPHSMSSKDSREIEILQSFILAKKIQHTLEDVIGSSSRWVYAWCAFVCVTTVDQLTVKCSVVILFGLINLYVVCK